MSRHPIANGTDILDRIDQETYQRER